MEAGYDVKMSEIHGMSQRGGSVSSQVRYGEKVESPVRNRRSRYTGFLFEKMEALRWLKYLKPDGKVVVNNYEICSMPILSGKFEYPTGIIEELSSKVPTTIVDAANMLLRLGIRRL